VNRIIKRGMTAAGLAPVAVVGMAGSAGAVVVTSAATQFENIVFANCSHPRDSLDLDISFRISLRGDGVGRQADDVRWMSVRASDDDGQGRFENEDAHVSKVQITLLRNAELRGRVTRSDHDFRRDGERYFAMTKDNISDVRVQVWWSKAGFEGDPYTVACLLDFDDIVRPTQ
jgi:hypothetical protein